MRSAVYEGRVLHARNHGVRHAFENRLALLYLDLAELDEVFRGRWLWSVDRPNLASFQRRDHLGDPALPLDVAVRAKVADALGFRPTGAVRLLTHARTLGYVFNPLSVYYCFDPGERLEAVVGEVTNTPWGERHCYVLDARAEPDARGALRLRSPKVFHVSPFLGMDLTYAWTIRAPGPRLELSIDALRGARPVFHAGLRLERREIGAGSLASVLLSHPAQTLRLHAAIYWQALRLHLRGARFHPHPAPAPRGEATR